MKKRPSAYLKMKVLGAVEFAEGNSVRQRIRAVSEQSFEDEEGIPHKFTWRTISTWLYRYKREYKKFCVIILRGILTKKISLKDTQ